MTETAMRDSNGDPVFVSNDGSYSNHFPAENIVRRSKSDTTKFDVYGFVGSHNDYTELRWSFDSEQEALSHASEIYGKKINTISHFGEVFEVEVHERDLV